MVAVAHHTFTSYITGQCTEAVILGSLCTVGMLIFRFPYAPMVGALVGATALLPIIGAYIGAFVGAFMILTVSPGQVIPFICFLVILQQLEGNLIYPRVVGSSIGLPAIWVLFAITVGGGIFGILGMVLGVPCMSVIYTVLREKVDGMPKRKNNSGKKRPHQKLRIPFFSKRTPASAEAEAEASTSESPEPEANATESSES